MTITVPDVVAIAPKSIAIGRSYPHLSHHDLPRIAAFLLSFNFDQRRAYFGGGISDHAVVAYCRAIKWTTTDMIARTGGYCIEALATIVSLPSDNERAEFAVACPLLCDQRPIVAELLARVKEFAAPKFRSLVVRRELAHPELICELRRSAVARFDDEQIEIDLLSSSRRRCAAESGRLHV